MEEQPFFLTEGVMANSRTPPYRYNGSGYLDKTAGEAISKADKELLKVRRKKTISKLKLLAEKDGFKIIGEIILSDVGVNDK